MVGKKLTQEEFIERMNNVFGDLYDFSEAIYVNFTTKVKCICRKHGEFFVRPDHLMDGHGCPKCACERIHNKQRLSEEDVKKRIDEVFNGKYDTSKIRYANQYEKVVLICPIHGEFKSSPNHLFKGHGCPKCGNVGRKDTESFKEELKNIFGDEYTYDKVVYKNNATKVIITCKKHGDFYATPTHLIYGHGCPHCSNSSTMERFVNSELNKMGVKAERQKRFKWLGRMSLDFFLPDYNIAIECQGIQHYEPVKIFGGDDSFKRRINNDEEKRKLCIEHGIKLKYIKYDDDIITALNTILL